MTLQFFGCLPIINRTRKLALTPLSLIQQQRVSMEPSKKAVTLDSVNPSLVNVQYAVRGPIVIRASELQEELNKGVSKKFKSIIRANIGDCHAVGQTPITFYRQVLAGCSYPELVKMNIFTKDVNERITFLLDSFKGSIGCYTDSIGVENIRKSIARYIEQRDGYPSNHKDIVITNGASGAVKLILYTLMRKHENGLKTGVLCPIPTYPLYTATLSEFDGELISYYLDEEHDWGLNVSECERAIAEGKGYSVPKAMVIINPGNPTGQVLTYENMVEIVQFCKRHNLVLLADEVYQHNIHETNKKFHSFKKVVRDCGYDESNFELVSFHSISKGFYGECGLRGGYMELFGFDPKVKAEMVKLISASLCSTSCGQAVLECVVNPPKETDQSFAKFSAEKSKILDELRLKANIIHSEFNSVPGITCNKIQGAMYAFPRLHLPEKCIQEAKKLKLAPDEYYCFSLLEETGICVVPGSGFKQIPGTFHFRTTILPSVNDIRDMARTIKTFHTDFMKKFQ